MSLGKNFKWNFFKIISALILSLLITQVLFFFAQLGESQSILRSVSSLLFKEGAILNPYNISLAVDDLESLGVIDCATIGDADAPSGKQFADTRFKHNCLRRSPWLLEGSEVATDLKAVNGHIWRVTFFAKNSGIFYVALWICRLLFVLLVIALKQWHDFRIRSEIRIQEMKREQYEGFVSLAAQMSHDIRSPLGSLMSIAASSDVSSHDISRRIQAAALRIRDISDSFLSRRRNELLSDQKNNRGVSSSLSKSGHSIESVDNLIEFLRLESNSSNTKFEVVADLDYGIFCEIQYVEFCRILSNIINNAREAMDGLSDGNVFVELRKEAGVAHITFSDSGRGIETNEIEDVLIGKTLGKTAGNGLGLSHAKKYLESWGGSISIVSKPGFGTQVAIALPVVTAPKWFVSEVRAKGSRFVVVEEIGEAIGLWSKKTGCLFTTIKHCNFIDWYRENLELIENSLFLVSSASSARKVTGLDLIQMTGIEKRSILVTDGFDDRAAIQACEKIGVKCIPLLSLPRVPVLSAS